MAVILFPPQYVNCKKKLTEDDPRNLYTSVLQLMPGEQYDAVSVKCEI